MVILGKKNITVKLKFDYLNKERKFREYIMEDEGRCKVKSGVKTRALSEDTGSNLGLFSVAKNDVT